MFSHVTSVWRRLSTFLFGYDFFISFSRGSGESRSDDLPPGKSLEYARSIDVALETKGFRCFIDEHELPPGSQIEPSIARAIAKSRAIVCIASKDAEHWVATELGHFQNNLGNFRQRAARLDIASSKDSRRAHIILVAF